MRKIYDIETLSNCFTYSDMDRDGGNIKQFVIHKDRDDSSELVAHLRGDAMMDWSGLTGMIGFNNINFDGQVIQWFLESYDNWIRTAKVGFLHDYDGEQIAKMIYDYAQKTIERMNKGGWPDYPEWKMSIPQLDLFRIWHFDNKAKMTSLKWIEYMIDMDSIQEMPIHHTSKVELKDIESILAYNLHDIKATLELYNITIGKTEHLLYKGNNKLELRRDIKKEFWMNCDNYNDVKIGDEINKLSYCKLAKIDKKKLPKPEKRVEKFTFGECYPSYYKFETTEFNNFVNALKDIKVNLNDKQKFEFTFNQTTYTIAKGGIHSNDYGRLVIPKENELLKDADIGSQYPNSIRKRKLFPRHLGELWLTGYVGTIHKRLDAKKDKKTSIAEAMKLALNGGGYGKLGEEYNWQYDPFAMTSVTIGNQIELLMLIEDLEVSGIHVISANTDGIVCLFDKNLEEKYYEICKDWEEQVGNNLLGQLEYADYRLLAQTSVNSYLALKVDSDKPKCKGEFVTDFELHKNKSSRIIPIALQEFFVNKIPVEKTILEHQGIYDFCNGVKSIGKNRLIAIDRKKQTEIQLQKINRYFVSTDGINIIKRLPKLDKKPASGQLDIFGNVSDDSRESEIEAGYLSTVFNTYVKKEIKDYNINYSYYIEKCNKILRQIIS